MAFPDTYGSQIGESSVGKSNAKVEPGIAYGETFTTVERRGTNSEHQTLHLYWEGGGKGII